MNANKSKSLHIPGWITNDSYLSNNIYYSNETYNVMGIVPQLHGCDFVCRQCHTCIRTHGANSIRCLSKCNSCWACDPAPHNGDLASAF